MFLIALKALAAKLLDPRVFIPILVLAVVGYLGYLGYNFIYDRGVKATEQKLLPQIAQLEKDLKSAKSIIAAHEATVLAQEEAHKNALQVQKDGYEKLLKESSAKVVKIETKSTNRKEKINVATPQFISPSVDTAFRVNVGFVWLYNESIKADPTATAEDLTVPADKRQAAEAPASIAISTLGRIAAQNNIECVRRGEVIEEWQRWYTGAKAVFEEAARTQANYVITLPSTIQPAPSP